MKKHIKKIIPILIFFIGIIIGYQNVKINPTIKITNQELINIIFSSSLPTTDKELYIKIIKNKLKDYYKNSINFLNVNLRHNTIPKTEILPVVNEVIERSPLIYIYNSHQTEEYETSTVLDYSIKPTVMISNYILKETFDNNNYQTYVEERSIKDILNNNAWKYSYSYNASRILLEERKQEFSSLKYFIDIHRDSLEKNKTTIEINGKSYAKLIFLIGLENSNYQANLEFTTKINNLINERYPNLSKGIYKKGGAGVNGIYNQDFSPYAILLEVGGYQNTPIEVLNSTLAFAECFMEVIKTYESWTTF